MEGGDGTSEIHDVIAAVVKMAVPLEIHISVEQRSVVWSSEGVRSFEIQR